MENENNIYDELMQDMLGVEEESNNTTDENTTEEPKKHIVPITEEIINTAENYSEENTLRFSASDWFEETKKSVVNLYGLGGIGSWTALGLTRAGFNVNGYDKDSVDSVNMAGQFYTKFDVGKTKVNAVNSNVRSFVQNAWFDTHSVNLYDHFIRILKEGYYNTFAKHFIDILALDSITLRKHIVSKIREDNNRYTINSLIIDARLAAEYMEIFAIPTKDKQKFEWYLNNCFFDSSEADAATCSYKQTSHCAMIIGGVITGLCVNYICNNIVENENSPFDVRRLPKKTIINLADFEIITED